VVVSLRKYQKNLQDSGRLELKILGTFGHPYYKEWPQALQL
jgi:hypothetical protein